MRLNMSLLYMNIFFLGQCTNYQLQKNQYRRSSGYQLTQSDIAISDNFLSEGWYRFESGAGNDMVTHAAPIAMCGTLYPVWLNGMNIPKISVYLFLSIMQYIPYYCNI